MLLPVPPVVGFHSPSLGNIGTQFPSARRLFLAGISLRCRYWLAGDTASRVQTVGQVDLMLVSLWLLHFTILSDHPFDFGELGPSQASPLLQLFHNLSH